MVSDRRIKCCLLTKNIARPIIEQEFQAVAKYLK
jgi:hypothetical protein